MCCAVAPRLEDIPFRRREAGRHSQPPARSGPTRPRPCSRYRLIHGTLYEGAHGAPRKGPGGARNLRKHGARGHSAIRFGSLHRRHYGRQRCAVSLEWDQNLRLLHQLADLRSPPLGGRGGVALGFRRYRAALVLSPLRPPPPLAARLALAPIEHSAALKYAVAHVVVPQPRAQPPRAVAKPSPAPAADADQAGLARPVAATFASFVVAPWLVESLDETGRVVVCGLR